MSAQITEPTIEQQYGIMHQIRRKYGVVADSDSYKLSHMPQYPQDGDLMVSYFESRGGERDRILWFGMQLLVMEFMLQRITQEQADNMIEWANEHLGGNMADDLRIALDAVVNDLDGKLPIRIRSAQEGLLIPIKNVLFTIETTIPDERYFSLVSYFETKLVRVWSPTTVATTSYYVREAILEALNKSADDPMAEIAFKFHDFGSRGISSMEGAAFAGAGHLVSFMGTDTQVAVQAIEIAYKMRMAGYSIAASEHSTTTMHGRYGEERLVQQMFDAYAKPGMVFATVIDSYDAMNFIRNIAPKFKQQLEESGALWVFRPDSGDPIRMPVQVVRELDKVFGSTVNTKGYKVLNGVRVIQGDGISPPQVTEILNALMAAGYSASNMAFGMGGGLLQKNNRDTHKFALKACAARIGGQWVDVFKDPSSYDENWNRVENAKSFKSSKAGRLELVVRGDEFKTIRLEELNDYIADGWTQGLQVLYENGNMVNTTTFEEIRRRSGTFT